MTTHAFSKKKVDFFFEKPSAVEFFKNVHVVLETRDFVYLKTFFRFIVYNHKKT